MVSPGSSRPIQFLHRGQVVRVQDVAPTRTALEWLREQSRCTGTKEGCAEGDCGACTVLVAELDDNAHPHAQGVKLSAINSCLRFLPTLNGKALLTVEDLTGPAFTSAGPDSPHDTPLHPAQQAMVECHGSQCGFCTPGFVMSLVAAYEDHHSGARPCDRAALTDAVSGNLCRCTGYRPILAAGQHMVTLPQRRLDRRALREALLALRDDEASTFEYAGPSAAQPGRTDRFIAPRTVQALAQHRLQQPHMRLLAGATDVGLWVTKQLRDVGDLLYVGEVGELQRLEVQDRVLHIGAAVRLEAAWQALTSHWPTLHSVWKRFAGMSVRQAGTLVGNLANGSPIGDAAPALMALDARLLLRRGEAVRELPLSSFYLGYMKNALAEGEWVQAVVVPLPGPFNPRTHEHLQVYKLSKRHDSDISAVCAGIWVRLSDDQVAGARLAFGGMAATVQRAVRTEALLLGRPWNAATVEAARSALAEDFSPIDDLRASAAYRREAAGALLQRFWLQTRAEQPLQAHEVSVWEADPTVEPLAR